MMRIVGRTEEKKVEADVEKAQVATIELPQGTAKRGKKAAAKTTAAAESSGSAD